MDHETKIKKSSHSEMPEVTSPKTKHIISILSPKELQDQYVTKDDVCEKCGYIYPFTVNSDGSREYFSGSWPFCTRGIKETHFSRRVEYLVRYGEYQLKVNTTGVKTVVFVNAKGDVSVPGNADEPAPKGYERRELLSLADVDNFNKQMQQKHRREYDNYHALESQRWNNYYREMGREAREGGINPYTGEKMPSWEEMSDIGKEMMRQAEKEFGDYRGYDPRHIPEVFILASQLDEGSMRHYGRD